jgi:UDP-N-acetylglucosamine 1-carboxyvinyltransferase
LPLESNKFDLCEEKKLASTRTAVPPTQQSQPVLKIVGGRPLSGFIPVSGAKNAALAIMAGAILSPEPCRITNIPKLMDIDTMSQVLESLGAKISFGEGWLEIDAGSIHSHKAPYELVSRLRASFFILGPMLARFGMARIPLPGGCAIGARPVELHVRGLQAMGADVRIEHGVVEAHARKLKGTKIYLDYPSVGATETLMMAATLAEGETVLENCAQEPEVSDLAGFCRALGARIHGAGTKTIVISGVPQLHGTEYGIIPDRIEAGTFLVAGAITNSSIVVGPVLTDHLTAPIAKLREIGYSVEPEGMNQLRVGPARERRREVHIETLPFPGFPTDMQAPFMALLTLGEGTSLISETVFENRMQHASELSRMGADIKIRSNHAIVRGVPFLSGAPVDATDLRASAALILAGLAAQGETHVAGLQYLDRGYDRIEEKLRRIGAELHRIEANLT